MLRRLDSLSLLGGGERLKSCIARILPNYSAFWKRNDSRMTLSSSKNSVNFSSADETSSVVTMCVTIQMVCPQESRPETQPPTPTSFTDLIGNYFPVPFQALESAFFMLHRRSRMINGNDDARADVHRYRCFKHSSRATRSSSGVASIKRYFRFPWQPRILLDRHYPNCL
jgi:hypothetical protein